MQSILRRNTQNSRLDFYENKPQKQDKLDRSCTKIKEIVINHNKLALPSLPGRWLPHVLLRIISSPKGQNRRCRLEDGVLIDLNE